MVVVDYDQQEEDFVENNDVTVTNG